MRSAAPANAATRVDRALGIREAVEFFGPSQARLAGTIHAPLGPARAALLICPSVCSDFLRNYRREVVLARDLASAGIATQRFHYRGTGNSDGDPLDLTFDSMCEDARSATARLQAAVGDLPVAVMGTRLGALVAASVARAHRRAPLVLLDPVLDPTAFFREGFRARMASAAKEGSQRAMTTDDLRAELAARGVIDVLGHSVGRALYETTTARSLRQELADGPRPLFLAQFGGKQGLRSDYQKLILDLRAAGFAVDSEIMGELMAWWFLDDQTGPEQGRLTSVATWLRQSLLEAGRAEEGGPAPGPNGMEAPAPDGLAAPAPNGAGAAKPSEGVATAVATTLDESPVLFPAAGEELFGILTRPTTEPNGAGVILLSGGAWTPSPGRNRIWVRLARGLAGSGFHALRFDYHGVGESSGLITGYALHEPFTDDVRGAAAQLEADGVSRFVLIGTCFGSRTALASAAALPGAVAVALLALPTRDFTMTDRIASLPTSWYVRKLLTPRTLVGLRDSEARSTYRRLFLKKVRWAVRRLRAGATGQQKAPGGAAPTRWASPQVVEQFRALVERGVPVLILYGRDDDFYHDFRRAQAGPLGEVLARAGGLVTVDLTDGRLHGLASSELQDHAIDTVTSWLSGMSRREMAAGSPHARLKDLTHTEKAQTGGAQ